jgi:hypothetical protein
MNYLDEIEAELGKESMKYVCDHKGRMCAWDDSRCLHSRPHEPLHGCNETIGDCKGKCIPVEPERVPGISGRCAAPANSECSHAGPSDQFCKYCTYWKPAEPERVSAVECSRANARCPVGRQYFEAGGKHFCHSRTSPCPHTWAQRMGMCVWETDERDWFVVSKNVGIGTATQLLVRRQDAQEVVTIGTSERRMFRWSDGVQG